MSGNSPGRNISLSLNILILAIIFVLGCVFFLIVMPPGGPRGVASVTTRGGRMLALRFPSTDSRSQRQIVVFDNTPSPRPRIVIFESVSPKAGAPFEEVQLSVEDWVRINNIREEWCKIPPDFPLEDGEPFYDIGIRCQEGGLRSSKRVVISIDKLPGALLTAINAFNH